MKEVRRRTKSAGPGRRAALGRMRYLKAKRGLDAAAALGSLIVLSPVFLFAAAGIRLSSEGPILFRAERMGKGGVPFTMYKFRTMEEQAQNIRIQKGYAEHKAGNGQAGAKETAPEGYELKKTGSGGRITSADDPRVFPFGRFLRRAKIDELPQLVNILKGDMAVIGPRPEDVSIVRTYYTKRQMHTLDILPGLASPGSIFHYTHGEAILKGEDAERAYTARLLPVKLELELYYVRHVSFVYDAAIVLRTLAVIAAQMCGVKRFWYPEEYRNMKRQQERARQARIRPNAVRGDETG